MTRGAELQRLAREGKRIRTEHIEVRVAASPFAYGVSSPTEEQQRMRIGLIVPLLKHSAVDRNKLKRRLREISRLHLLPLELPLDVVLRIRPQAYAATFDALTRDINVALVELQRFRPVPIVPTGSSPAKDDTP